MRAGGRSRLRFLSLGSGSRGNAALIQSGQTLLLLDCGYPARELAARCQAIGVDPNRIDAVLLTHEHGDHSKGVGAVARRFDLPVWMTEGSRRADCFGELRDLRCFNGHDGAFDIGDIRVQPFTVPHDAREPCQFVFSVGSTRLGFLTDLGSITPHVVESIDAVDALVLEFNHDPQMLAAGPYPPSLQARVGGGFGHLSNDQALGLLDAIDRERLHHLVAAHLSEKNNCRDLVRDSLTQHLGNSPIRLTILEQDRGSSWFDL